MPFNGSGGFQPLAAPIYPAIPGTTILADQYNLSLNDLFLGLTNCITRDGQSPATANLPMGNNRHTGASAATANGQYIVYGQSYALLESPTIRGVAEFTEYAPVCLFDPIAGVDLTRKSYVDTAIATALSGVGGDFVPLAGGSMTGTLNVTTTNPASNASVNLSTTSTTGTRIGLSSLVSGAGAGTGVYGSVDVAGFGSGVYGRRAGSGGGGGVFGDAGVSNGSSQNGVFGRFIGTGTDGSGVRGENISPGFGYGISAIRKLSDAGAIESFAYGGYFSGSVHAGIYAGAVAGTDRYAVYADGATYWKGLATVEGHVRPQTSLTYDLGSSTLNWNTMFTRTLRSSIETQNLSIEAPEGRVLMSAGGSTVLDFGLVGGAKFLSAAYTQSVSVAYNAAITIPSFTSNAFEIGVLTGNTTLTLTNTVGGHTMSIRVKQDATGGRTVTLPGTAKVTGAIGTGANVASILTVTYSNQDSRWEGSWTVLPV